MANEKRLIDANALRQVLQKNIDETQNWRTQKAGKTEAWRYVDEIYKLDNWLGIYAECADLVDDAPTVDAVEVVHARWVDANGIRKSKCENCGVEFCRVMDGDCYYCPNCGAKMDGGNEE